ncbi:MAG TPA: DUF3090 family protein [Acidimicrobiales bacterium]|nr:DUF3090 family protein [Acidimicrobiales bacterium]
MSSSFDFTAVDRITIGTVGPPGQRAFFLQARQGPDLVTLKLEKSQVAALATYLGELLQGMARPGHLPEDLDLEEPVVAEWVIGTLGITYDEEIDRFLLVAEEVAMDDEDAGEARFFVSREQVAALAIRGTQLVEAGRPPCPLCGYPLDPKGHACPRTNGHRPPTL